jgi:SAM-dependent methyltransferase
MSSSILMTESEIGRSRSALRRMKASCLAPWPITFLRKYGLAGGVNLGDRMKSWDILKTATFLLDNLPKSAPVLDIGAYASEILPALHRLGYSTLSGIDLNPGILGMPCGDVIRYEIGDFMRTPFADASFDAVTAISVIEHGLDAPRLLAELTRLLRPEGYFIASFDYWPEKVDTAGLKIFGMDWTIFSREEVLGFLSSAKTYGLEPVGNIALDAGDKVIRWGGKQYTFGWLALRKKA